MIEKKHKLGYRIFEDYDGGYGYRKKKGMHWKTFEPLRDKFWELEHQIDYGIAVRLGALEGITKGGIQ